jgi:hypothetical protein
MRNAGLVLWCVLVASPALAQSPYVVGSFGMDVSRLGGVESGGFQSPGRDGEVMSGALRVGASLGDRWGVELEFARGAAMDAEASFGPRPLFTPSPGAVGITFSSNSAIPVPIGAPIALNFRQRLEQRHQSLGTVAWIRQGVADRIDLVYLGGIAFWRTTREQEFAFTFPVLQGIPVFLPPPSQRTRTTMYGVDPVVGVEAHVGLTEHVRLVPGLRLQGIGDPEGSGWLLRAGVGLGWFF